MIPLVLSLPPSIHRPDFEPDHLVHQWLKTTDLRPWGGLKLPHPDVLEVGESTKAPTIAQIRAFSQEILYPPHQLPQRLAILWRLDEASIPAQNALLKILEEPPAHAQLLATVTRWDRLLPTIQSRVSRVIVAVEPEGIGEQSQIGLAKSVAKTNTQTDGETNAESDAESDHKHRAGTIQTLAERLSLETWWDAASWRDLTWGKLIDLAKAWSDRPQALDLVHAWTLEVMAHPEYPSRFLLLQLEVLEQSRQALEANSNVSLTLETLFFSLKLQKNRFRPI